MPNALPIVATFLFGLIVGVGVMALWRRRENDLAKRLFEAARCEKAEELAALTEQLKMTFSALSRDALSANTTDFLKLAQTKLEQQTSQGEQTLDAKKKLIDARLDEMTHKLTTLNSVIQATERQRAESHGALRGQIESATKATQRLQETTGHLREALGSKQRRGQWGERMAADVLRLVGMIEGVNYVKQTTLEDRGRPDFTFFLPGGRKVHMDVKFPFDNYMRTLEATDDAIRLASEKQFLKDVRARIKEVTTRAYIDPADGTVDYVLVFIPNEQVYGFIHERDTTLLDDALRSKVVLCSPLTLYAVLAVMRQAVENFRLEQASAKILTLLADFKKQWAKYAEGTDRMYDRLTKATEECGQLVGVRRRQLERQLDRIDDLQQAKADAPESKKRVADELAGSSTSGAADG